jgi:hypothetical protein
MALITIPITILLVTQTIAQIDSTAILANLLFILWCSIQAGIKKTITTKTQKSIFTVLLSVCIPIISYMGATPQGPFS